MKNKDIDYSSNIPQPEAEKNLLSPTEWFNLKNKIVWGTATFAEKNKYNMILKSLEKNGNKKD